MMPAPQALTMAPRSSYQATPESMETANEKRPT